MLYEVITFDDLSMKIDPLLQGKSNNEQETLVTFLNYLYEYRKIFAVLFEHKGFKNNMFNLLKNTIEKRRNVRKIQYTREVVSVDIIASSLLGIIMWWIKDGTQFSSEYIADQIRITSYNVCYTKLLRFESAISGGGILINNGRQGRSLA